MAAVPQRVVSFINVVGCGTEPSGGIRQNRHCNIAGRTETLFSGDAIPVIHNAARDHPRAVNNLAVNALNGRVRQKSCRRRRECSAPAIIVSDAARMLVPLLSCCRRPAPVASMFAYRKTLAAPDLVLRRSVHRDPGIGG